MHAQPILAHAPTLLPALTHSYCGCAAQWFQGEREKVYLLWKARDVVEGTNCIHKVPEAAHSLPCHCY